MTDVTLITPEATDTTASAATGVEGAAASAAPAAAPEAAQGSEAGEGQAAAADGQGAGNEQATNGGASEGEGASASKDGTDAANGAPENYADFAMPEGFTIDADYGTDLKTIAKELNLPQDKAQKLVDLGVKHAQGVMTALKTNQDQAIAQWSAEAQADKEIGGESFAANMSTAKKALVAFGTPELTGLLNATGLSRHPEFLRLLVRVGSAISEDTLVDGGSSSGGGAGPRDHARRLYPKQA